MKLTFTQRQQIKESLKAFGRFILYVLAILLSIIIVEMIVGGFLDAPTKPVDNYGEFTQF